MIDPPNPLQPIAVVLLASMGLLGLLAMIPARRFGNCRRNLIGLGLVSAACALHRRIVVHGLGWEFRSIENYWESNVAAGQFLDDGISAQLFVLGIGVPLLLLAWAAYVSLQPRDRPLFWDHWRGWAWWPLREPPLPPRPRWLFDQSDWPATVAEFAADRGVDPERASKPPPLPSAPGRAAR